MSLETATRGGTTRVPAEVVIRPADSPANPHDRTGGRCAFHPWRDTAYVATVLINDVPALVVGLCGECELLIKDGVDRPDRAFIVTSGW